MHLKSTWGFNLSCDTSLNASDIPTFAAVIYNLPKYEVKTVFSITLQAKLQLAFLNTFIFKVYHKNNTFFF